MGGIVDETPLQHVSARIQKAKDMVYATLLVVLTGLGTVSFLVLGDLISTGTRATLLKVAITAFAVALPVLAAAYWSIRIWYYTAESEPSAYRARGRAQAEAMAGRRVKLWETAIGSSNDSDYLVVIASLEYAGLLIVLPAVGVIWLGIITALWHTFWAAGLAFTAATISGVLYVLVTGFIRAFQ